MSDYYIKVECDPTDSRPFRWMAKVMRKHDYIDRMEYLTVGSSRRAVERRARRALGRIGGRKSFTLRVDPSP